MKNPLIPLRNKLALRPANDSPMLEETRHLWTKLQLLFRQGLPPVLRIAFTSTYSGEGTSSIASNFAHTLAEQRLMTCLVECNFREPSLRAHYKAPKNKGLGDFLEGKANLTEILNRKVSPHLDLVHAGTIQSDPYALLSGPLLPRVLGALHEEHEALVLDTPPLSNCPESCLVLRNVDAVVLVVQANRTKKSAAKRSMATLDALGVPILGAVLNQMAYQPPVTIEQNFCGRRITTRAGRGQMS